MKKYVFRFFFEWGTNLCLWSANDAARERYGIGCVDYNFLDISDGLKLTLAKMGDEYQSKLDWEYPPNPSPWTKKQLRDFKKRSKQVYKQLRAELGKDYKILFKL